MKTNRKITEWQSLVTGNIVNTFGEVIKQVWDDLIHCHILNVKWKRTRKELELPSTIWADPIYISDEWFLLDKWGKEWAISCHLVDNYGFAHKGFEYEEDHRVVTITNIKWDLEE